jgi:hypothetical protein
LAYELEIVIVVVAAVAVIVLLVLGYRNRAKVASSPMSPTPASSLVTTAAVVEPAPEPVREEMPPAVPEPVTEPAKPVEAPAASVPAVEPVFEKPAEVPASVTPEPVVESLPATEVTGSAPIIEPKPPAKRVRSTKPRKPRTTKAKKETGP